MLRHWHIKLKMMENYYMESHKQWLKKAESDLRASEKLASDELVWDVAIYHTQQCAEKA
jgi:HEPN domain-containing protein